MTRKSFTQQGNLDTTENTISSEIAPLPLLDVYAQDWQSGIGGIPAKRWQEGIQSGFLPTLHTSAEETRILLMRTSSRTVQRYGIEFENLYYRSADLTRLRSTLSEKEREVKIKYDPADLGAIYVSDPINRCWLRVPAASDVYAKGLSLWKHRIIVRYAQAQKAEVNIEALARAKEHIRKIVADEFILTKKSRGRKLAERYRDRNAQKALSESPVDKPKEVVSQPQMEQQSLQGGDLQTGQGSDLQQTTSTDAKRGSDTAHPKGKKVNAAPSTPESLPLSDNEDLDLSGWGGAYHFPHSNEDLNDTPR